MHAQPSRSRNRVPTQVVLVRCGYELVVAQSNESLGWVDYIGFILIGHESDPFINTSPSLLDVSRTIRVTITLHLGSHCHECDMTVCSCDRKAHVEKLYPTEIFNGLIDVLLDHELVECTKIV